MLAVGGYKKLLPNSTTRIESWLDVVYCTNDGGTFPYHITDERMVDISEI